MKTLLPVMPAKAGIHDFTIHEKASIAFPKWRQHRHCEERSDDAIQNHALQKPEAHPVRQHRPNAAASVTHRSGSGLRRRYAPRNDGALAIYGLLNHRAALQAVKDAARRQRSQT